LYQNKKAQRDYERSNEPVAEWVYKERTSIKHEQHTIRLKKQEAQQQLIEMVK